MAVMNVVCPANAAPGQQIPVQAPDGRLFHVVVPAGTKPGHQFTIQVPEAAAAVPVTAEPVTAVPLTATPAQAEASPVPAQQRTADDEKDNPYDKAGRANTWCLTFFGICSAGLLLALTVEISWWFASGDCYPVLQCCTSECISYCLDEVCRGSVTLETRPITQDAFPEPVYDPDSGEFSTKGGNGSPDFWSIIVAVACGGLAAAIAIVISCLPPAVRGKAPPKAITGCIVFAWVLNVTTVICVGVQLMTKKNDGRVYNHFRFPQYETLNDESILGYWLYDRYYSWYGTILLIAYIFVCLSAIWECGFLVCMYKLDHRLTRPTRGRPTGQRSTAGAVAGQL